MAASKETSLKTFAGVPIEYVDIDTFDNPPKGRDYIYIHKFPDNSDSIAYQLSAVVGGHLVGVDIGAKTFEEVLETIKESLLVSSLSHAREVVAEQGYGLEVLVNDDSAAVREAVARQGCGLEILINDEDYSVRKAAEMKSEELEIEQRGYQQALEDIYKLSGKDYREELEVEKTVKSWMKASRDNDIKRYLKTLSTRLNDVVDKELEQLLDNYSNGIIDRCEVTASILTAVEPLIKEEIDLVRAEEEDEGRLNAFAELEKIFGEGVISFEKGHVVIGQDGQDVLIYQPKGVQKYCIAHGYDREDQSWRTGSYRDSLADAAMEFDPEYKETKKEAVASIIWQREDIASALQERGYEPTDENIDELLNNHRLERSLQDLSTEEGWETISMLIDGAKDSLKSLEPSKTKIQSANYCPAIKVETVSKKPNKGR